MAELLLKRSKWINACIIINLFITIYFLLPIFFQVTNIRLNGDNWRIFFIMFPGLSMGIGAYKLIGNPLKLADFKAIKYPYLLKKFALMVIFALISNLIWFSILEYFGFVFETPEVVKLFKSDNIYVVITALIGAVIIAPIVEEVVFRRIIYDGFCEVLSKKKSIIYTSIIFSICHMVFFQIVGLFVLGFLFQKLANEKDLSYAVMAHAFNNLFASLLLLII